MHFLRCHLLLFVIILGIYATNKRYFGSEVFTIVNRPKGFDPYEVKCHFTRCYHEDTRNSATAEQHNQLCQGGYEVIGHYNKPTDLDEDSHCEARDYFHVENRQCDTHSVLCCQNITQVVQEEENP